MTSNQRNEWWDCCYWRGWAIPSSFLSFTSSFLSLTSSFSRMSFLTSLPWWVLLPSQFFLGPAVKTKCYNTNISRIGIFLFGFVLKSRMQESVSFRLIPYKSMDIIHWFETFHLIVIFDPGRHDFLISSFFPFLPFFLQCFLCFLQFFLLLFSSIHDQVNMFPFFFFLPLTGNYLILLLLSSWLYQSQFVSIVFFI